MPKKATIVSISIVVLFVIALALIINGKKTSNVKSIYNKMQKSQKYTFSMEETSTDINYKVSMAQRGEDVSIDMYSDEEHTTTLILDNKSYYIMHNDKEYYDNGEEKVESDIVLSGLRSISQKQYTTGKEELNGKTYYFEEYENENMDFIIFANINESSKVKTRFYFSGNNICFIKNFIESEDGKQEELIKVTLKYEIDDSLFAIPEDYAEAAD